MLEHSREFIVLAQRANFRLAAAELNLSQPSLSRHIAELEHEIGAKLLDRNPVALTPVGKLYLESIGGIIERLDETISNCRALVQDSEEAIGVAMIPSASLMTDMAYAAFALLRIKNPQLTMHTCTNKALNSYELAVRGEADVALLSCKPTVVPEGFSCEWLMDSESAVWTHRNSPLLSKPSVSMEDLANQHLIASTNQIFDSWTESQKASLRAQGIEPKVRLKALDTLFDFALSIQPDEIMLSEKNNPDPSARCNPNLVRVPSIEKRLFSSYYALYRTDPRNPLAEQFVEACMRTAAEVTAVHE